MILAYSFAWEPFLVPWLKGALQYTQLSGEKVTFISELGRGGTKDLQRELPEIEMHRALRNYGTPAALIDHVRSIINEREVSSVVLILDMLYSTVKSEEALDHSVHSWSRGEQLYNIKMFANVLTTYFSAIGVNIVLLMDDGHQMKHLHLSGDKTMAFYHHMNGTPNGLMEHDSKLYPYEYYPWMQYQYCVLHHNEHNLNVEKSIDFMFGMNAVEKKEPHLVRYNFIHDFMIPAAAKHPEWMLRVNNHKNLPEFIDKGFRSKVSYPEYLAELATAKMTIIAPSTHDKMFSLRRFIEAVERNCLPFIHEVSNWRDGLCNDPTLIDIAEDYLVTDDEDLVEKIERMKNVQRVDILNSIRDSKIYREWYSIGKHTQQAKELFKCK